MLISGSSSVKALALTMLPLFAGTALGEEARCIPSKSSTSACTDQGVDEQVKLQLTRVQSKRQEPEGAVGEDDLVDFPVDDNARLSAEEVPDGGGATSESDFIMMKEITNCATEYCHLYLKPRVVRLKNGATYTRGFDGGLDEFPIGPTIRIKPGDTLKIILHNQLGEYNPSPEEAAEHLGVEFNKKETYIGYLNSTNLHTHGLHCSGSKFADRTEDFIFASIEPQNTRQYDIELPNSHMGGLCWYHAHHHHSTAVQAGGGSAGLLVVEDPPGYFESAGIPEITSMREILMILNFVDEPYLSTIASGGDDRLMKIDGTDKILYVNGQLLPVLTVQPGEWVRVRMCFSAVEKTVRAHLAKQADSDATCEMQLLATDGVYLHEMPRTVTSISLWPGARSDFAMRCTCPDGASDCSVKFHSSDAPRENYGSVDTDVFEVQVSGAVVSSSTLPVASVRRPCYVVDLRGVEVPEANQHELGLDGRKKAARWKQDPSSEWGKWITMPWFEPMEPSEEKLEELALGTMELGQVHQITFSGFSHHPFHLHVNPYQIQDWAESLNDEYFRSGDWHDVMMDPEDTGAVRLQTDRFAKESVIHCHFIRHEDSGMMGWLWIPESDNKIWTGAEDVDPTCYRDFFPQ